MEEMLIDTPCFRHFAWIDMIEDCSPDETTILNIRHLLEEHRIAEKTLETVNQSLCLRGLKLREGTILNATIIISPVRPRTRRASRTLKCTLPPMASSCSSDAMKASPTGWAATLVLMQPQIRVTPRADSKSHHGFVPGCRRALASSAVMSCITACMPALID
jgi:IS5 family transposase